MPRGRIDAKQTTEVEKGNNKGRQQTKMSSFFNSSPSDIKTTSKSDQNSKDATKVAEPSTPVEVKQIANERTKRARMGGIDKTPEGNTPKKRKPSTRARTLKDVLNTYHQNSEPSPIKNTDIEKIPENNQENTNSCINDNDVVIARTFPSKIVSTGKGTCPAARWGHSLCMINESEAVMVGGQGDKQKLCNDSIWRLDITKEKWSVPDTTAVGQKPEMRMGHTAVYDPTLRSIYVYGGSKNIKWFNDVHVLNLDEMSWQLVKANGKAPTRAYHSATLYRHELWIFGGVFPQPDPQPDGCSNDIHVFSPIEESWYLPIVMGEKPIPRSGHSATLLEDKLVVFGGWDAPVPYQDLHVLDLCLVDWSQPKFNGTPPSPRSWHGSCALSGNRVLIHGGYNGDLALDDSHIFNLDTLTWLSIKLEPSILPRCGHAVLCLPYKYENQGKDEVFICGGGDNDGSFFKDLITMLVPKEPAITQSAMII